MAIPLFWECSLNESYKRPEYSPEVIFFLKRLSFSFFYAPLVLTVDSSIAVEIRDMEFITHFDRGQNKCENSR